MGKSTSKRFGLLMFMILFFICMFHSNWRTKPYEISLNFKWACNLVIEMFTSRGLGEMDYTF